MQMKLRGCVMRMKEDVLQKNTPNESRKLIPKHKMSRLKRK